MRRATWAPVLCVLLLASPACGGYGDEPGGGGGGVNPADYYGDQDTGPPPEVYEDAPEEFVEQNCPDLETSGDPYEDADRCVEEQAPDDYGDVYEEQDPYAGYEPDAGDYP